MIMLQRIRLHGKVTGAGYSMVSSHMEGKGSMRGKGLSPAN